MRRGLSRLSWNSIRLKLVVGLLLITLPTVAFLIYNNLYAIRVVHNQVAESSRDLITLYMEQIDNNLNDVDTYLTNLLISDKDLQAMEYMASEPDRILAQVRLNDRMSADINTLKSVDSIFVYSKPGKDYLEAFQDRSSAGEREEVRGYIRQMIANLEQSDGGVLSHWYVKRIGQNYYLFRVLETSDAYAGAWVNIDNLSSPLDLLKLGEKGVSLFATQGGVPITHADYVHENRIQLNRNWQRYHLSGDRNQYLVVGAPSSKGDFCLIALIPDDQILENLPYLRRLVGIISIVSLILIPVFLLLLRRTVLRPLGRIIFAMRRFGEGNLNTRIEPYPTSDEFYLVNRTFNQMTEQINELRIHVYEEQLNKQKAELQHLQLQINPHFFMNSLNIIHNLAFVRNFELIQEMALSLVHYFRYMFRSNLTFVLLKEELQHVRYYMRIQELRFPGRLDFHIQAPEYLLETRIPPLSIQTFAENAVKHAVASERIRISVHIDLDDSGPEPRLSIQIRDTGKGFPEHILKEIRAGNRVVDDQGEHIGIWNVKRRLGLLYGELAGISFENAASSGAVVDMRLPLDPNTNTGVSEQHDEAAAGR